MRELVVLITVLAVAPVALAVPAVYVDEDFESYADTAEMQAVWGAAGAGTLDVSIGLSPTQSMAHPGGANNIINLASDLIPTDAEPVVLRGAIYDDGTTSNKRFTIGIRSLSTFPLFEMGAYNAVAGEAYAVRVTSFPGQSPNWVGLGLGSSATAGWHTYEATFTGSDITVTVDLGSDGSIDTTKNWALTGSYSNGLGQLRLGGPSGLSSSVGGNFDDIYLAQVPEPTMLALMLPALALLRRRHA